MIAKQKVLLVVMDGLGAAPNSEGNAVTLADPKNLSSMWITNPRTYLIASGEAVGLPKNVKGNSEVGHLNIGSGQIMNQTLPRINKSIERGSFFKSSQLYNSLVHATRHNGDVHVMGLLSDGSVHSHISHFFAVLRYFSENGFKNKVYFHIFTDGRDTGVNDSIEFIKQLERHFEMTGTGEIATICGRRYGMDRNRSWDRTKLAYDLITKGIGEEFRSPQEGIEASYEKGLTDEFINPIVINKTQITPGDSVIHMNFRADRALQLTSAFIDSTFTGFQREIIPNIYFASMVEYRKNFPSNVLVPKQYITMPLGRIISSNSLKQLRIAESEKFPHVTYFFNGGMSIRYENEDRIEIPSPPVPLYDQKPEMSADELTDILINRINADIYDFIVVNYANPDMVAHTGNLEASIKAVQTVDRCVKDLVNVFLGKGGAVILTADHGNAEELINIDTGEIDTEHSLNPVPFILLGTKLSARMLPYGALKDITPTILQLMGIPQPLEVTGQSLIRGLENF
jgi:2,3-bisphosphoglycerate-independent phosphoglycerate mutase